MLRSSANYQEVFVYLEQNLDRLQRVLGLDQTWVQEERGYAKSEGGSGHNI